MIASVDGDPAGIQTRLKLQGPGGRRPAGAHGSSAGADYQREGGADPIPGQIPRSEKGPLWEVTMQKEDISLLRIYAKNDMNCVKTAKEMGIHQSSVIYRFGKIKTETGLDARKFWDLVMLLEMEES